MNATMPDLSTTSATSNGTPVSPEELVRALSPEDKEDVFVLLIRELIASNGGKGLIPVETPEGEPLGYYVPPEPAKELAEKQWNAMPAEVRERLSRPVKDLDNCISADEMLAHLSRATGSTVR